ncbi:MAG: alpha/beta hydrolase, partial [Catenulispora sp.]|nr:alpha/beta hydrolase [Catenulispora sp.]
PGAHRLAVLPNTTHYTIFESPTLVTVVEDFLNA